MMSNMSAGTAVAMMEGVHMSDDNINSTWERGRRERGRDGGEYMVRNMERDGKSSPSCRCSFVWLEGKYS